LPELIKRLPGKAPGSHKKARRKEMKRIKIVAVTLLFVMTGALTSFAQGWQAKDSSWEYEKADGAMASQEWIQDNCVWYYLKADGLMAHQEWIEDNGVRYYLEESGIWNSDVQEVADRQNDDAAEEERYQQWLQSIEDGEPEEILN